MKKGDNVYIYSEIRGVIKTEIDYVKEITLDGVKQPTVYGVYKSFGQAIPDELTEEDIFLTLEDLISKLKKDAIARIEEDHLIDLSVYYAQYKDGILPDSKKL